nr:hypothetical protein [uncultured Cohaesibacter sp.]
MFGGVRKKVTKQTIDLVRMPYGIYQSNFGIPADFWQDKFVLGFFGGMIGIVSFVLSANRLNLTEKGCVLQDTFSALSNMDGVALARNFADLANEKPMQADFDKGVNNGQIVALALMGKTDPSDRDLIEQAKFEAVSQGLMANEFPLILAKRLFVNPLNERFNSEAQISNSDPVLEVKEILLELGYKLTDYGKSVVELSLGSGYSIYETASSILVASFARNIRTIMEYRTDPRNFISFSLLGTEILKTLKVAKEQRLMREEIWVNDAGAIGKLMYPSPDTLKWAEMVLSDPVLSHDILAVADERLWKD